MEKRLSTVEFYQIKSAVMTVLIKKYGSFPLAETKHRREEERKQLNFFNQRTAPRKWKGAKNC
jgi:hypothetical protein